MARFPIVEAEVLATRVSGIVGVRIPAWKAVRIAKAVMEAVEAAVVREGDATIHGHGKFVARPCPVYPPTGDRCKDRVSMAYLPSRTAKDRMSEASAASAKTEKRKKQ